MRRPRHRAPAAALFALVACAEGGTPPPDVVVRIGSRELPYSRFEAYLRENSVAPDEGLGSDVLSGLFDQFLAEELLHGLAVERGVVERGASRRAAVAGLLDRALAESVGGDEIASYYRDHREEFAAPERVELRQVLLQDRERAADARSAWAGGMPYEEVVRTFTDYPDGQRAEEGRLTRDDLPPVFADTIFRLEPGEVSAVVAVEYGFHIFQVTSRMPAEVVPLEAAAPEIRRRLSRERADRQLEQLVADARQRYTVRVFGRNIPFNYDGSF